MIIPTVHINGTGREALVAQQSAAYQALLQALSDMREATPHGRDYYVQQPDGLRQAQLEHDSRMQRVQAVADEYLELGMRIQDQPG